MFKLKIKLLNKWTNKYIKLAHQMGNLKISNSELTVCEKIGGNSFGVIKFDEFLENYIDMDIKELYEFLDESSIDLICELRSVYSHYAVSKWNSIIAIVISFSSGVIIELISKILI